MADFDNFLFVGDSFTWGLKDKVGMAPYGKDINWVCEIGLKASDLLSNKWWSKMPKADKVKGIILLVGVNSWQNPATEIVNTEKLIKKLLDKYPDVKLYVQRVFPVSNKKFDATYGVYSGGRLIKGYKTCNTAVAKMNKANLALCNKTDGAYYIDTTKGFSNNAILIPDKTSDGLHIIDYDKWRKNIVDAVKNAASGGATENPNGYPAVFKKLLPDNISGQAYKTSGFDPKFIVIHNMGGGTCSNNQTAYDWFAKGSAGNSVSAHYCVEPGEIWQVCEDTWTAHHCGGGTDKHPGTKAGAKNSTSFGIEMADGTDIDKPAALENVIELTRHLMKTYNIPVENIYQHYEIDGKGCPWWIRQEKKWDYLLDEVKKRNKNNDPIKLFFSDGAPGSNNNSNNGTLPNFDNREDLINIEKVKSLVLVNHPPQHFISKNGKEEEWKTEVYDRNFHFEVDEKGFKTKVDNTLITWGMQPNDKHTYIDRALHQNKPYKFVLNLGIFTPEEMKDYSEVEKIMVNRIGKVLWDNALETKDIWREFDLNRAPSPFMYLEREQWKKLLREIDKQVKWRYENFGEPPVDKEVEETDGLTDEEVEAKKKNIGKKGKTIKQCSLWKNPEMIVADRKAIIKKDKAIEVLDFDKNGYYKVEVEETAATGWVWHLSLEIEGDESTTPPETETPEGGDEAFKNSKAPEETPETPENPEEEEEGDPEKDPEETEKGKGIPQPEITPTMTHEEYLEWKKLTDPRIIDNFAGECEPYDKGLEEIINAEITEDDRTAALTEKLDTRNENTIYFNCVEGSPGTDGSHCSKNANELNMLIKPDPYNVDPIYPDLIIPPNYSTTNYNIKSSNALPLTVLLDKTGPIKDQKDFDSNDLFFDYNLLKDKKKESKGKPTNYLDPYPYDDKIYELENHKPKVKIDEIEARLYDSNHPGDPVAHPIAKNFANVYDMAINQSKKVESRLVRLENTLATALRNLGRVGSRININCVYYGGQDVFGKYKTIRCLKDDRIHDAGSMTLDQCLCCTRYEPIIGQIYEILDDTGVNGSVMLDNMQMSYMDLEETRNLNRVEERNSLRKFVNVNREEKETPKKLTETWETADKDKYIEQLKKDITDEKELTAKLEAIKQEDYAFRMNWLEQDLDIQEPDVKLYPTEGIKAKYKAEEKENTENEDSAIPDKEKMFNDSRITIDGPNGEIDVDVDTIPDKDLIDDTDQDYKEDLDKLDKLNNGEWVDTREEADTFEKNIYTSEDYFFEGFNSVNSTPGNGMGGAEARNKIVEMAKQIVQDHLDKKACYTNSFRTNDYNSPQMGYDKNVSEEKIAGYDCSSLVSCCYNNAGLKEITNKRTISMWQYAQASSTNGCKIWDATKTSASEAQPGDIILTKGQGHTAIYLGSEGVAHASSNKHPHPKQIRIDSLEKFLTYSIPNGVFLRPADLLAADAAASNSGGGIENPDFSGNSVAEQIFNFVKSQGGSDACAAGIVGNCYTESNFKSNLINEIGCTGLFQLWKDRLTAMKNYCASKGKPWTDVQCQIEYMWMEVTGAKGAVNFASHNLKLKGYTLEQFKNISSPEESAALFEHFYEVAGNKSKYCPFILKGKSCRFCGSSRKESDHHANKRETYARSAYNNYGGK